MLDLQCGNSVVLRPDLVRGMRVRYLLRDGSFLMRPVRGRVHLEIWGVLMLVLRCWQIQLASDGELHPMHSWPLQPNWVVVMFQLFSWHLHGHLGQLLVYLV